MDPMELYDPVLAGKRVTMVFERIHREQMAGLPLLNNALKVATIEFQLFGGRVIGIVSTPWMMSLLMLPGADDRWQSLAMGEKQSHDFPGGTYRFLVNVLDGLGVCQMHSIYSPMRDFPNQASAVAAAGDFLDRLMTPAPASDGEAPVDEELLGRILRGENIPEIETALASSAAGPVPP